MHVDEDRPALFRGTRGLVQDREAIVVELPGPQTRGGPERAATIADGINYLLVALRRMPEASITWPTMLQQRRLARGVNGTYGFAPIPGTHNVFAAIDGVRFQIFNPADVATQNGYYSAFVGYTNINCVIIFDMMGRIIFVSSNNDGRTTDFTAAIPAFRKMKDRAVTGINSIVAADDAFSSAATDRKIATAKKYNPGFRLAPHERVAWSSWILCIRKSVEWGMKTLQSVWARLQMPLPTDPILRQKMPLVHCPNYERPKHEHIAHSSPSRVTMTKFSDMVAVK